ncbi:MAG: hypothetical protein M0R46_14560 [Candidatus Muirbacterium halophilum]|nr:hypothetical protein [Candidatus Muirbacterium halophilum]
MWRPCDDTFSYFLTDTEDLRDSSIVKQYIEYNGFDKEVYEIWQYMSDNYKLYPSKITELGMVYSFNINIFIEIMFKNKTPNWFSIFNRNGNTTERGNLIPIYGSNYTSIALYNEVNKRIKLK